MNEGFNEVLEKLGLLDPIKQGILVLILSGLLFISMLILNGDVPWSYKAPSNCYSELMRCGGLIGLGLNMTSWAIISCIGFSLGLIRIFVVNIK